ncbi:MAG TPA: metallophosphoesterase family protein [Terriglobia bacterium]|nr:metallophosphoesterase family protein [Terriglobia bacterium]
MRYLILSDIHSNIEGLAACTQRAKDAGYDRVLCCGDLVGYGPNPVEAIDGIRGLNAITIRGNHDRVAAGLDEAAQFNPHARLAVYWTRSVLPESYRDYLANLPVGPIDVNEDAQLVHGAVTDEDDYIFTEADADENFILARKRITFFGHSHFPVVFCSDDDGNSVLATSYEFDEFIAVKCETDGKLFVNPGSVGQPRDGDPRSSFAIWDQDRGRIEFYRVEYDVSLTQKKMREAQLPGYLVQRLAHGR